MENNYCNICNKYNNGCFIPILYTCTCTLHHNCISKYNFICNTHNIHTKPFNTINKNISYTNNSNNIVSYTTLTNLQKFVIKHMNTTDINIIKNLNTLDPYNYIDENNSNHNNNNSYKSGVLAIKMGLGKTIISINYIIQNNLFPALIILPPNLIIQWKNEIIKNSNASILIYDNNNNKEDIYNVNFILMSSYKIDHINKQEKKIHKFIKNIKTIFIDEAHTFRNNKTARYANISKLTNKNINNNLVNTWALTGTPICNSQKDIINIKNIVNNNNINIEQFLMNNFINILNNNSNNYNNIIFNNFFVMLDDNHTQKYFDTIIDMKNNNNNTCILSQILRLRQVVNHPDIAIPNNIYNNNIDNIPYNKINTIINILNNIPNNDKIVIFVEWTRLQTHLKHFLNLNGHFPIIHNNINDINAFTNNDNNNNNNRILITNIKSGGTGLNLQIANHGIFLSPNWNDANIKQAIGRFDRIGQQKNIYIYNIYAHNTIETWINQIVNQKINITNNFYNDNTITNFDQISSSNTLKDFFLNNYYKDNNDFIKHINKLFNTFFINYNNNINYNYNNNSHFDLHNNKICQICNNNILNGQDTLTHSCSNIFHLSCAQNKQNINCNNCYKTINYTNINNNIINNFNNNFSDIPPNYNSNDLPPNYNTIFNNNNNINIDTPPPYSP